MESSFYITRYNSMHEEIKGKGSAGSVYKTKETTQQLHVWLRHKYTTGN